MPALLQLGAHGYPEHLVRRRSLEWLHAATEAIDKRAMAAAGVALASMAVAAKAPWMPEANETVSEMLSTLLGTQDSTDDWLLNPNATTDLEALRASGLVQRVKKENSDAESA